MMRFAWRNLGPKMDHQLKGPVSQMITANKRLNEVAMDTAGKLEAANTLNVELNAWQLSPPALHPIRRKPATAEGLLKGSNDKQTVAPLPSIRPS
eukprot:TRINITY_DN2866_c1_g1_i1.p2 TRINITY_DN2866_c1_g1~~TRINITY_DN2866_c1_g1_i1.p2  ORF type:complete len:108 (-),score=24.19 TRINITY_DN2866_c1_g1_i1:80-364(-)